eukprot:scaffold812_cov126-Isochrysis_galbana.AAC.1
MSQPAAREEGAKVWERRVPRAAAMSGMRARRWRAISRTMVTPQARRRLEVGGVEGLETRVTAGGDPPNATRDSSGGGGGGL